MTTKCPICGKSIDSADAASDRKAFPFCSERCKLVDLGRWLDGKYQIPVREEDDEGEMPPGDLEE